MQRFLIVLTALLLAAPLFALALNARGDSTEEVIRAPAAASAGAPAPAASAEETGPLFAAPGEDSVYQDAAAVAWRYIEEQYQPATGLVNSVAAYPYATMWDVGSTLGAYYSARELGLITQEDYDRRMGTALRTLSRLPLFADAAFNKNYQIARGALAGRNDRESTRGYGWSATDLGRLLVWLKIVSTGHPQHAQAAAAVVDRLSMESIVKDGYLWAQALNRVGQQREYQEGRLGYEQYAAAGFALWGEYAEEALSARENAVEGEVLGVPILTDRRSGAHLTSEPFVLTGLEVGWWSPHWREQAESVLRAQEERFERTGQVTIASEDALPVPPYYFYYYTIRSNLDDFAVVSLVSTQPLAGPRWVSAKAALGWHALFPRPYTWRAVEAVAPAAVESTGWNSGVYEGSGRPTGSPNINTAAVILEAALYRQLRKPILEGAVQRGSSPTP